MAADDCRSGLTALEALLGRVLREVVTRVASGAPLSWLGNVPLQFDFAG